MYSITDVIRIKARLQWGKIPTDSTRPLHELLPDPRDQGALEKGDTFISCHVSQLNVINAVLRIDVFST